MGSARIAGENDGLAVWGFRNGDDSNGGVCDRDLDGETNPRDLCPLRQPRSATMSGLATIVGSTGRGRRS